MSLKKEEKHKTFDLTAETVSLCVIFSSVYLFRSIYDWTVSLKEALSR